MQYTDYANFNDKRPANMELVDQQCCHVYCLRSCNWWRYCGWYLDNISSREGKYADIGISLLIVLLIPSAETLVWYNWNCFVASLYSQTITATQHTTNAKMLTSTTADMALQMIFSQITIECIVYDLDPAGDHLAHCHGEGVCRGEDGPTIEVTLLPVQSSSASKRPTEAVGEDALSTGETWEGEKVEAGGTRVEEKIRRVTGRYSRGMDNVLKVIEKRVTIVCI